jgi:hypothetical protein
LATDFTNSIFSITRTRTTTRNNPIRISGVCHLSLCSQTAPQRPLFPGVVWGKASYLFIQIPSCMGRIFLTKYFRHQDAKTRSLNNNKHLLFVSWCLCGYSFQFTRVRRQRISLPRLR